MDNQEIVDIEDLADDTIECQNLKCPICHNIFNEPKACGNCLNHFCKNCIDAWRTTKPDQCPLCKHYSSSKPVPILINLLSKLKFKCPNRQSGCDAIISYEEYFKHCHQCPEKIIECQSQGCFESFKLKDQVQHYEACPYTYVSCVWCQRSYIRNQMRSHIPECPQRLQKCIYCLDQFKLFELQAHSQKCPKKPMQCKWCKKQIFLSQLRDHQITCDMKQVNCLGCKIKIKLFQFYPHQNICQDYPVVCNRCNESVKRKQFKDHGIDKCVEFLSKRYQQEVSYLKSQNSTLRQRLAKLEIAEQKSRKQVTMFSQVLRDPDIFVNKNFAMVRQHKKKNRDRFLLMDTQPIGSSRISWKIKVLSFKSQWFAIGISDETNVYTVRRYQTLGHNSYLASANGTIYSTHNILWNHQRADFLIQENDEIQCIFEPHPRPILSVINIDKDKSVSIEINKNQIQTKKYYPCICLRFAGDSVEIVRNQ